MCRAVDTAVGRTVAMKVVRLSEYATPQEARTLREQLFREAHAAGGLTHIMVQNDGTVKLTDFGIAKVAWTKTMTGTGMVTGSPHYMAPEQLKGESVSGRTDQFALAGVAYTLLTDRKPFEADTMASLFHKILHEEPVRAQALNPTLCPQSAAAGCAIEGSQDVKKQILDDCDSDSEIALRGW